MLGARPGKREIINGKDAFQMITMHFQFNHPQPHVVHGAPHHQLGVGGQCKTEKDPRRALPWLGKTSMFTFTDYGSGV